MGNTVTKESIPTPRVHPNGRSSSSGNSSVYERSGNSVVGTDTERPPRKSHRHRHSSEKSHRRRKEGYEMIIDLNETVDGGYLYPQGVYHGGQDYKVSNVRNLIIKRKLAPFYKGLDSVNPSWSDQELYDHVKITETPPPPKEGQPGPPTEEQVIWLYRNVHECPICFLVYPRLNTTRCCAQDICTECFVQIKRNPPHPPYTHDTDQATDVLELLSEPAACPYCAQADLGVIFEAPPFEWGIPSSKKALSPPQSSQKPHSSDTSNSSSQINLKESASIAESPAENLPPRRRGSIPASHDSVVTVDTIRPDWEEKLASARRRLARKSAAARALHRAALLPNNSTSEPTRSGNSPAKVYTAAELAANSSDPSLNGLLRATRSMSIRQTRELERKMLDEAIKASLAQS